MDYIELNLEELNDFQIESTNGGGFFNDLGVGTHILWNSFVEFCDTHTITSHSRQGI